MPTDYDAMRNLLEECLREAEAAFLNSGSPSIPEGLAEHFAALFLSKTQAYREALLGCLLARMHDPTVNIRLPYAGQGPSAYNGRDLDEKVVNPILQGRQIPCSKGPFLAVFRRSVKFTSKTIGGLKDKKGYNSFLALLSAMERTSVQGELRRLLVCHLFHFVRLRESSKVSLTRLRRLSLTQLDCLVAGLLSTPSGGRFPVVLVVAAFQTIKEHFRLNWEVSFQGINVADSAGGAGGDITIKQAGRVVLAAEVTERLVNKARVVQTFNTKIAVAGLEEYLFFILPEGVAHEAEEQAHQYFGQGHEVNFLVIKDWLHMVLGTTGRPGRAIFNAKLMELLEGAETPKGLKVAWNIQVSRLLGGS